MGSACCVAARGKDLRIDRSSRRGGGGGGLQRSGRCSPSWSFRWENPRRRVAGENEDSPYQISPGGGEGAAVKRPGGGGNLFDGGSPVHESFGTPISFKSPIHEEEGEEEEVMGVNLIAHSSDVSVGGNYPIEVKHLAESPDIAELSLPKFSYAMHSSLSTPAADSVPTIGHPLPPNSTPSRRARYSPGRRLLRQISDSRILGFKSPNNYSSSGGRSPFVLSTGSHDFATGSFAGSSDGWSMQTFSELVASSQRERWSFDSEHLGLGFGKISECSSRFSYSPSLDLQTCGACSKSLTEKSSWSSQRIMATNELSMVAVLACGHVYHAECLETMTLEVDRYDPACPLCMGEKQVSKTSRKALRAGRELRAKSHRISRNRVIDSYLDSDSDEFYHPKKHMYGDFARAEPSSSAAGSSTKPFLKRHFSLGSKWGRSLSINDSPKKKGFWARHRRD